MLKQDHMNTATLKNDDEAKGSLTRSSTAFAATQENFEEFANALVVATGADRDGVSLDECLTREEQEVSDTVLELNIVSISGMSVGNNQKPDQYLVLITVDGNKYEAKCRSLKQGDKGQLTFDRTVAIPVCPNINESE